MSEQSYKTAWRELREWLEETIKVRRYNDNIIAETQLELVLEALNELEKSHDLD